MEMNNPLVSIITVNYNGLIYTQDFLKSLRAISYTNIEIFVVDNASSQSIAPLKTAFPEVTFIESKVNLGFRIMRRSATERSRLFFPIASAQSSR